MSKRILYFTLLTIILALFLSPFASSAPDGLERVAHDLGFISLEKDPLYEIFPDYSLTFIQDEKISTALSGLLGLLIIGLLTFIWIKLTKRKQIREE